MPNVDQILFDNSEVRSVAMGVRTELLKRCRVFLQSGSIDIKKMKKKPIVLLINTVDNYKKRKIINVTKYKVGDTVKLKLPFISSGKRKERTYSCIVGGILSFNSGVCLQTANGMPAFIFHNDMMKKLSNTSLYQGVYITLDKGLSKESIKKISTKMKSIALSIPQGNFSDSTKEDAQSKSMTEQEEIIELAILWSLIIIAVVNIFNTASTNLYVRTREFGLMKIVGITARQLKGIVFVEMAIYGVVSTIFAFLGGLISGYKDIHGIEYIISWRSLIIVFCSYMVFSLLAAVMPLRRIIKSNAVESIRMVE
jgi:putative ABC transport system permease protein